MVNAGQQIEVVLGNLSKYELLRRIHNVLAMLPLETELWNEGDVVHSYNNCLSKVRNLLLEANTTEVIEQPLEDETRPINQINSRLLFDGFDEVFHHHLP